uniref:Rho GTPase activating protein 6 n=1 Tax=Poecilia latipinna TaxID=48699 RepID=A0A3B3UZ51_9TELE
DGHKHKKSLRKKLDSLSKEKSRDKETSPQAFGIPLSHVITNDRVHKLRHDHQREEQSNTTELMLSFLHLSSGFKRPNKELSSSNSSLSSTPESHNDSPLPSTPDIASRTSRRGGVSVDCITDLDDNQARLLEALQLSLPDEAAGNRKKPRDKKLSLNPIYRQVPRIVDLCCQHLEKNGTNFRNSRNFPRWDHNPWSQLVAQAKELRQRVFCPEFCACRGEFSHHQCCPKDDRCL